MRRRWVRNNRFGGRAYESRDGWQVIERFGGWHLHAPNGHYHGCYPYAWLARRNAR